MAISIVNRQAVNFNAPDAVTGLPKRDQYLDFVDESGAVIATLNVPASNIPTFAVNGASVQTVYSQTATLTDDQIKALPTTQVEIVAAPGAGKIIIPLFGGSAVLTGANYTNKSSDALLSVSMAGFVFYSYEIASLVDFGEDAFLPFIVATANLPETTALMANEPLMITVDNTLGNFTGGDPANTLKVTVLYTVIDV